MGRVSVVAKRFLNAWNFLILVVGCGLLLITLYILLFQSDSYAVPKLGYWASVVCGGLLVLLAGLGLYGLRQHRYCVTKGKRNVALGTYCIVGFIVGIVLVVAGAVAFQLNALLDNARYSNDDDVHGMYLEEAVVNNLHDYAVASPAQWKKMQNDWFCCGYYNVTTIQYALDIPYIDMGHNLNSMGGIYCNTNCTAGSSSATVCPQNNTDWCRDVFLKNAETNNIWVAWVSVVGGFMQLLGFLLGTFILMCDIRMVQRASTLTATMFKKVLKEQSSSKA
ncbi:Aste57867_23156 [Aphanomyces stellatus]|uniref:Aste57867_23156 protein n=1 Tax=Aphanomyces stellatus TaxID=120398 RepID=A0A485LNW7_9STRA|nr:hypothetical protein As57867_023085 [Aphanomyces stellatus]VFT99804.1 Aste57867_23156 [Aphanomyces stellatus]